MPVPQEPYGPQTEVSKNLHQEKYRAPNEGFDDLCVRIAGALGDEPEEFDSILDILRRMAWLPAGRQQLAVGSPHKVTAFNCLAGDTLILTREYGAVPIREVANRKVHLLDGNGDWVLCPVLDHGEQETVRAEFKGGYENIPIRSTMEHGWVRPDGASQFKTKALASSTSSKRDVGYLRPSKRIEDQAQYHNGVVHGLIYGDGTKTSDGMFTIRVCANHEDIEPWLEDFSFSKPPSSSGDPHYYISAAKAWAELKEFPKEPGKCLDYLLGFLRGWFAADGCVSEQPEVSICGDATEKDWLSRWAPLAGWHVRGSSMLASETNFGQRKKASENIRLKRSSMDLEDFLLRHHAARWEVLGEKADTERSWRMHAPLDDRRVERVYCPVVPTTHSFALPHGVHSANCYVSGVIPDDFNKIMDTARDCGETMRMGGGVGMDFSTLRPRGDLIRSSSTMSSGPVSFMRIWDTVCSTISSKGLRRGAMMGVLRVDHPDIEEFVRAKHNEGELTNFNVSVAITDEFMTAVKNRDPEFPLRFQGKVYKKICAATLWEEIMRSTWDWAEPGVIFIDRINKMNPLSYCETIATVNPCGEQPLPANGACLLGSMNCTAYLLGDEPGAMTFDFDQFEKDLKVVVMATDRIIDRTKFPLPAQEAEAKNKRRMGIGVTGVANALELMGHRYASDGYLFVQSRILKTLRDTAYLASVDLAKKLGAFPKFDADRWLASGFAKTLPEHLREEIAQHGLRNGMLLSIAPTGTISFCADNISSGIEPPFSHKVERDVILSDGKIQVDVLDWAYWKHGYKCLTADEISAQDHVRVLCEAQKFIDSAISKTCNVGDRVSFDEFKEIYETAYLSGAKGCTTFRAAGKRYGVMRKTDIQEDEATEGAACFIDPQTGARECA